MVWSQFLGCLSFFKVSNIKTSFFFFPKGYVRSNFQIFSPSKIWKVQKLLPHHQKIFDVFFLFCNWGHLTEVSTGSAFEAMSIPFAFQTQAGSRARISHVRNLTKLIMSILSRNFPSGTVNGFYKIVGFILVFGSPFYWPVPKDGSVKKFLGNIFDSIYIRYIKFVKYYFLCENGCSLAIFFHFF